MWPLPLHTYTGMHAEAHTGTPMEVDENFGSTREDNTTKFPSPCVPNDHSIMGSPMASNLPECAAKLCNKTVWYSQDPRLPAEMKAFEHCSSSCRNKYLKASTELMKGEISEMETKLLSMKTSLKDYTCLNEADKPKVQEVPKPKSKPSIVDSSGKGHSTAQTG